MQKDLISVIVTVYNRENMIQRCIESILNQTEVQTELLLVDDDSRDRSLKICRSYEEEHGDIKVFHDKNRGISQCRNVGLDNATGEFIVFLDDDDIMTPGSLKLMLDAMHKYDVDIVVGNFERVNENGDFVCTNKMANWVKNKVITVDEFWKASFEKEGYLAFIVNWGKMYRAKIWDTLRFPPEYRKSEDEYVLADVLEQCRQIYVTDQIVHKQTLTSNSITRAKKTTIKVLRAPESKFVTVSKLIRLGKYEFAVKKWGIACGEVVIYTKKATDKAMLGELKRLYGISLAQGKQLFRYFGPDKRWKFYFYLCCYPIFRMDALIRLKFEK